MNMPDTRVATHILRLAASFSRNTRVTVENPIMSWEEMKAEVEALSKIEREILLDLVKVLKDADKEREEVKFGTINSN